MNIIYLHNIVLKSLSNPHHDLPDDTQVAAQLIVEESIFLQTLPIKKDAVFDSWKLKIDCEIPAYASYLTIAIVRVSLSGGTRLLGSVKTSSGEILTLREQKKDFSTDLVKVNHDGPILHLTAGFSSSSSTSHSAFHDHEIDAVENRVSSLGNRMIWPQLQQMYESAQKLDSMEMLVMYERILLLPDTTKARPQFLKLLGDICMKHYQASQEVYDLNQAICLYYDAVRDGVDGTMAATYMADLGISLSRRFRRLGNLDDMNKSILMFEDAVRLTTEGHPDKPSLLNDLGSSLLRRFERLGDLDDMNKSILMKADAVRLTPEGHPDKPCLLNNLGNSLFRRFEQLGDLDDINECMLMFEDAVRLAPEGHPDKPSSFNSLGSSLLSRFKRLGDLDDMNKSILMFEDAVRLTPEGHPDKPSFLNNLGSSLLRRFERLGKPDDINKSILMKADAVRLTPEAHLGKPSLLNNLGNSLFRRFELLGNLDDMNKSILMKEDAVRLTPDGHPNKPSFLNNIGSSLFHRFERLGDLDDMNKSILMFGDAVQLTPEGHPNKPSFLSNLGNSLFCRFERLGNLDDINKSILMLEDAVPLTPEGHPNKPSWLDNLGSSLFRRFERLGNLDDMNKSILMFEDAVQLTPEGHPDKPSRFNNLGNSLLGRFERLGDLHDMNTCILMFEDAVRLTPEGHHNKPSFLNNLGNSLFHRFEQLSDSSCLDAAIHQFSVAASSAVGSTSVRFQASSMWARCAQLSAKHSPLAAYAIALQLLPELAWLGLSIPDRHHRLLKAGVLVRDAVSAAIDFGKYDTAIEWLEQGRSVVWGQLLQLRTPVDDLRDEDLSLANRLEYLSKQLEGAGTGGDLITPDTELPQPLEASAKRYHALAHERDQLLKQIRELPGFDMFMLPKKFSQLIPAARGGPVIAVNVSKSRCDALILLPDLDDVLHIPLNEISQQDCEQLQRSLYAVLRHKNVLRHKKLDARHAKLAHTSSGSKNSEQEFERILSQLWLCIVRPILNGMAITTPFEHTPPRVWWSLTGPLAFLPIHAAGLYGENESSVQGSKLVDYVVSSYTPTLTALIDGLKPRAQSNPKVLAVALPLESGLPCVQKEIDSIGKHGTVSKLLETEATVKNVVMGMQQANWVHFACHGVHDISNPTKSALLLAGHARLTLSDISKLSLPHAELAYLSACQTATGAEDLSEEAVHLTAGMLLAGYRGVVGTMWSIRDDDAPKVADAVYAHLFKEPHPDPSQTAFALQEAVRKLRNESKEKKSFLSWVPYIHVGI